MIFSTLTNYISARSWTYIWFLWLALVIIFFLFIRSAPAKMSESLENVNVLSSASSYFYNLTPKFYVALTGTSSLVSGIILIFEWWFSSSVDTTSEDGSDNEDATESSKPIAECKVWRNPMALFRGAEYNRFKSIVFLDPLTFHDMNLSAQDHQSFFTCEEDVNRPDYDIMNVAFRERDSDARITAAKEALRINEDCAPALVLLAEEECPTIAEAEIMLKRALRATELSLSSIQGSQLVAHEKFSLDSYQRQGARRRDLNMLMYIRRRLAMCARKQGRSRDSIKTFKEIIREGSMSNVLGVQENLVESCLEVQAYADVQGLLVRYDDIREPRSAVMSYTSALLKARAVVDKFVFDPCQRRGLTSGEITAIEAIIRAIEYNPHVPIYLLEQQSMILPPEHYLKRGDSEAISYAFAHIQHWKRIDGALQLLEAVWKGEFSDYTSRFPIGGFCYPYSNYIEMGDRELLPCWHEVSIFPKKESTFWSVIQTCCCIFIGLLAILIHYYPSNASDIYSTFLIVSKTLLSYSLNFLQSWIPENVIGLLSSRPQPSPHREIN
ncbi:unnamed protein product [Auanema sp. JU1783]|nr:unnamed protein product [Auanema sp. JU1783]